MFLLSSFFCQRHLRLYKYLDSTFGQLNFSPQNKSRRNKNVHLVDNDRQTNLTQLTSDKSLHNYVYKHKHSEFIISNILYKYLIYDIQYRYI